jgi:protein-disulfide isomerase
MGSNSAPIKVFIWSDFQCPNCRRIIEPMKYLVRKYPNDVQVIFKQNPLPSHNKAYDAARAALAASRQGKFWEYHEVLFQNMGQLGVDKLLDYARNMGLDMVQFRLDMDSKSVKKQIEYETDIAKRFEITGKTSF